MISAYKQRPKTTNFWKKSY